MSREEQQNAFGDALDRLIERFRDEFELTYADVTGVLSLKLHFMCQEAYESVTEDEDNES